MCIKCGKYTGSLKYCHECLKNLGKKHKSKILRERRQYYTEKRQRWFKTKHKSGRNKDYYRLHIILMKDTWIKKRIEMEDMKARLKLEMKKGKG